MFFTIYKITNKINGKFYIGMHKTKDLNDGYMGSGKLIRRAIKKYGLENFSKEILHICDSEKDMKNKEKELVIIGEMSYNLCDGGHGGFGYINRETLGNPSTAGKKGREKTDSILYEKYGENWRSVISKKNQNWKIALEVARQKYPDGAFAGKKHNEETKKKIGEASSKAQKGSGNSQYGTCWITNGRENKKIKKDDIEIWVKQGYCRGRVINLSCGTIFSKSG